MHAGLILESDLTGVEVIKCVVLTHGWIHDSTESVRGRGARPSLHLTEDSMFGEINSIVDSSPDPVFAYREIPALRFDSNHGSLLVADLWGDTLYKPFTGIKGRKYLTDTTPLLRIAQAAQAQAAKTPGSQVSVSVIGQEKTTPLKPRGHLLAFSSYTIFSDDPADFWTEFKWAKDENDYKATHARSVKKNFEKLRKVITEDLANANGK
ncbi:MAG: hypothetical protein K9G12_06900 [Candidatus Nanopelagicales bacterium]|nr:hypothetical protein [Candidatus Nanopelagicales bacterium]MCF8539992.1 hypothetical protein [Candidatus Nanopelagicales bacterium]